MTGEQFTSAIAVRMEPELREAIKHRARSEHTTATEWMRRALRSVIQTTTPKGPTTLPPQPPVTRAQALAVLTDDVAAMLRDLWDTPGAVEAQEAYRVALMDEVDNAIGALAMIRHGLSADGEAAVLNGYLEQHHDTMRRFQKGLRAFGSFGLIVSAANQEG